MYYSQIFTKLTLNRRGNFSECFVCVCVLQVTLEKLRGSNWMGAVDFLTISCVSWSAQISSIIIRYNKHNRTRYPFPSFGPTPKVLESVVIVEISWVATRRKTRGQFWRHSKSSHLLSNYCSYICHGKFNISMLYNYFILKIQSLKK